jgi:integrase
MERQPSRERVLTNDELKAVWHAAVEFGYAFGTIVQLLILTGQRKTEIGSLEWTQVQKDAFHLPASRTKNGRAHDVPLGPLALSLLPKRRSGYVFTATGSKDVYNGYTYHLRLLQKASGTSDWTLHDLRRTFATNLAILGTPIHVTEKLLNHVSGSLSGVAAIYNRHSYAEEMRAAQLAWEVALIRIVGKQPSENPVDKPPAEG